MPYLDHLERAIAMASASSPFFQDHSFDPFLFADIGEERNGMLLSVVSALARLDLDPWFEAASLSRLTAPAATQRLTSLLSSLPSTQLRVPTPATIMRLVGLLPKAASDAPRSPDGTVAAAAKMPWPAMALIVAALTVMLAAQYVARRESQGSGLAAPAASVTNPRAAKERAE